MIVMNAFGDNAENLLDFFLSNIKYKKEIIQSQITCAKVEFQDSEYFKIFSFHFSNQPEMLNDKKLYAIEVVVKHFDEKAPTFFLLHIEDEIIAELEVFNADSSQLILEEICIGEVKVEYLKEVFLPNDKQLLLRNEDVRGWTIYYAVHMNGDWEIKSSFRRTDNDSGTGVIFQDPTSETVALENLVRKYIKEDFFN